MKFHTFGKEVYFDVPSNSYVFTFAFVDPDNAESMYDMLINLDCNALGRLSARRSYFANNRGLRSMLHLIFASVPAAEVDEWFLTMADDFLSSLPTAISVQDQLQQATFELNPPALADVVAWLKRSAISFARV